MIDKNLNGERKWTYYVKKILENMINTDKELSKHSYKIYCDTDGVKKTLSAVISLNKYIPSRYFNYRRYYCVWYIILYT